MKPRLLRKRVRKQGLAPGTLESPKGALQSSMDVFGYDSESIQELANVSLEDLKQLRTKWPMLWVNITGLGDASLIAAIGAFFNIHPLALEDVLNVPQRSKTDEYEDHVFVVVQMIEQRQGTPILDQLSLFWGRDFVLTIQEQPGDSFHYVRERLRKGGRRTSMSHPDYMAYALLDAVVDGYFPFLEQYGEAVDALEERVLKKPEREVIEALHMQKRDLQSLRLCLWPMREAISKLRSDRGFIREETMLYMRDCQDHIVQVLEIIESYRERLSSINDLYLSSVSNKLNEVMKVLTIISTIFIPLSFVAGVYGMNFDTSYPANMPELHQPHGYVMVMLFMASVAFVMLAGFWRAGWIGWPAAIKKKKTKKL